ncbi:MAG: ribonuclease BN [Micromonosporaceae bacterium]|nr:ribonuclease BN [Micromonosporaceae bacterium]
MVLSRVTGWYERTVARARGRSELVDHGFRAKDRYAGAFGGRLAAAIAYYGFFATFALGLVGYSVLGLLLERQAELEDTVSQFLSENLPVLQVEDISAGAGTAGLLGLVGLVLAGVAWVDALRSSQRRIWELEQEPGNPLLRRAVDVLVLLGLALLVGASVAVAAGIQWLLGGVPVLRHFGWVLELGINLAVAVALLAALPRLRISPGRLLPAAAAVAVGILLLNTLGGIYIDRVRHNPAYAVVATAAGLLVYLYLFHQLLLAGAAWVATARRGRMRDLGGGSGPAPDGPVDR